MAALNDLVTPSLTFEEILSDGSTLTNPAADTRRLFLGEDGLFHMRDSAGTVTSVGGGAMATDPLWDNAGDLAVGTGANTAAKLAMGTALQVLRVNAGATALEYATPSAGASNLASASYVRTAGDYTWSSATFADVDATNMKLTLVTGARRVLIAVTAVINIVGAGSYLAFDVSMDGTRLANTTYGMVAIQSPVGNYWVNASFVFITDVLTAASHEFRLMRRGDGSNTATLNGTTAVPCKFAAVELYAA